MSEEYRKRMGELIHLLAPQPTKPELTIIMGIELDDFPIEHFGFEDHKVLKFPECGLHPKEQVVITESIARLINRHNQKLLLFTHSPYILEQICNLMKMHKSNWEENKEFTLTKNNEAFLNPDHVAIYEYTEHKEIIPLITDDYDVHYPSAEKVSNYLLNTYFDIKMVNQDD